MLSSSCYTTGINFSNGLIRTPNALLNSEGTISFLYSNFDPFVHGRITLSPYDWLEGSFFYTDINTERYAGTKQSNKDKGFALKLKIKEQGRFPAVALGFEDIAGTVLFSSEYLVSTYEWDRFNFSLGIGWGRLGSLENFVNPLSIFSDDINQRSGSSSNTGGTFAFGNYFRGDASVFGGVDVTISEKKNIVFKVEYDSMNFNKQRGYIAKESTRYNYGIYLEPLNNFSLGLYRTEGNDLGLSLQYKKNFSLVKKNEFVNSASRSRNISNIKLLNDSKNNGVYIQKANIEEESLDIRYIQTKRNNEKIFSKEYKNYLIKEYGFYETIVLSPQNGPLLQESYFFKNGVLKAITYDQDLNKKYTFQPRVIYPVNAFNISPGIKSHIGSPSGFIFAELNLNFSFISVISEGVEFGSNYTVPIIDNYEKLNYDPAYTDLHPVRIDVQKYLRKGQLGFDEFYLSKISQINKSTYVLFTAGHLEQMYSGAYFEYLKELNTLNLKLGFELAYVKQRAFEKGFFDFRDYETYTSHLNVSYYEPYLDIYVDFSFGRYLAKDDGYTLSLSRGFKNGLEIGAFFTLTNITTSQFGEGSFDKGIFFNYPIDIFRKGKSKGYQSFKYRPITRDGGSKVYVPKDLIGILRNPSSINY